MRFVVYGAGGVGGVVGGRLAQGGHEVALIARGSHYEAIRHRGLRLESPDSTATLELPVFNHPDGLTWSDDDVVLLAMKTQDTQAAIDALSITASPATTIVCMQNGVANEPMALRRFPNVYGICVMCPTAHLTPGIVQAWSEPVTGLLDIGRFPEGADEKARVIAKALRASTFESEARPDIMRWKYGKLLLNLGNAVEALCGAAARGSAVVKAARHEGVACLNAAGIAFVSEEEDGERRADHVHLRPIGGQRRSGGSSWQSLGRGLKTMETDYLNGEIVLLGRMHGIPTPVNTLLQRLARDAAHEGRAPGTMSVDALESMLGQSLEPKA